MSSATRRKQASQAANLLTGAVLVAALAVQGLPDGPLRGYVDRWQTIRTIGGRTHARWDSVQALAHAAYGPVRSADAVEFVDSECTFCRLSASDVATRTSRGLKLAVVHMPQPGHPLARRAAELALCAQGSSAEAGLHHHLLTTEAWRSPFPAERDSTWTHLLRDPVVSACVRSGEGSRRVTQHLALAKELGVRGTPTYVTRAGFVTNDISAVPPSDGETTTIRP